MVALATAVITSAVTSWSQFSGYSAKLQRYTEAITTLKNIQSWWMSLSEVDEYRSGPGLIS